MQLFADLGAGRSSSGDVAVSVGPARSAICSFLQILEQFGLFSSRSGQTVNCARGIAAHLKLSSGAQERSIFSIIDLWGSKGITLLQTCSKTDGFCWSGTCVGFGFLAKLYSYSVANVFKKCWLLVVSQML